MKKYLLILTIMLTSCSFSVQIKDQDKKIYPYISEGYQCQSFENNKLKNCISLRGERSIFYKVKEIINPTNILLVE